MVDSGRFGEAHESWSGDLGELSRDFILVVPVRCERHCGAGDLRGTAAVSSRRVHGCGIHCCCHACADECSPAESSSNRGEGELNAMRALVETFAGRSGSSWVAHEGRTAVRKQATDVLMLIRRSHADAIPLSEHGFGGSSRCWF
jgi:hypothetical protein